MKKKMKQIKTWAKAPENKAKLEKIANKVMAVSLWAVMCCIMLSGNMVFASKAPTEAAEGAAGSGNASGLLETILEWAGKLVTALGVVYAAFGIVHYAAANSEGDGPAKQKAMQQIGAGVMLLIISAIIIGGASTLSSFLTT